MRRFPSPGLLLAVAATTTTPSSLSLLLCRVTFAFHPATTTTFTRRTQRRIIANYSPCGLPLFASTSDEWDDSVSSDSNQWQSSEFDDDSQATADQPDWQETMAAKKDGSFWNSFLGSDKDKKRKKNRRKGRRDNNKDDEDEEQQRQATALPVDEQVQEDAWLQQLAELSSEEVEFNLREADRGRQSPANGRMGVCSGDY